MSSQVEHTVRVAVPSDADEIANLHVRAWQWAYKGLVPARYLAALTETLPRRKASRRRLLVDAGDTVTWDSVRGGQIVGFADAGRSRDDDATESTGELFSVYVDETVARQGVGSVLLSVAVGHLRATGFREITLWVLDSNRRARHFYEALGWFADGAVKVEARPPVELQEVRYRLPF